MGSERGFRGLGAQGLGSSEHKLMEGKQTPSGLKARRAYSFDKIKHTTMQSNT